MSAAPEGPEPRPAAPEALGWRALLGLGNPGERYAATRHNAGWMALEALRKHWELEEWRTGGGDVAWARGQAGAVSGGPDLWLVRPLAYMNRSGQAFARWLEDPTGGAPPAAHAWLRESLAGEVAARAPEAESPPGDGQAPCSVGGARDCPWLLAVVDDMDLPLGRVRLRAGGTDGGHNGLADVGRALGTERFPRLRVGVGRPPPGLDPVDWVLRPTEGEELRSLRHAAEWAAQAAACWALEGLAKAQQGFNGAMAPMRT